MKKANPNATTANLFSLQDLMLLLDINKTISQAKTPVELLATIREKVMQLIPFYDTGIMIVEKDGLHHYDMAVVIKGRDDSTTNVALRCVDIQKIVHKNSPLEYVMNNLEMKGGVMIESYEYLAANFDLPHLPVIIKAGIKEGLVALLKSNGKTFGTLWFNSQERKYFKKDQFPLFQLIAEQVSVAVTNILANEEILEREKEKDVLLNISQQLSSVKTADELLHTILREVKPVFNFYDTGILLIDEGANGYYDLAVIHPHIDNSEINYYLHSKGYYSGQLNDLANSGVEWMIQQCNKETPGVFDYCMDYSSFSDHELLSEIKKAGYTQAWVCPLIQQGKIFGVLTLNFTKDQQIPFEKKHLLLALTDRISSSLSNILANEDILGREKEKTLLLNISNSIAQINNKVGLLKSINELLRPIFHHDDAGFSIVDKEQKNFTDYYNLHSNEIPHSEEAKYLNSVIYNQFYNADNSTIPFPDSIVEYYMYRKPEMGKLQDVLSLNLNADMLMLEIQHGLVYYICSPLTIGGKTFGLFNLLFKEENKPTTASLGLFAQIAEIMALAFSNILANEEIIEREQDKTILLELTELIAQVKNKDDLLRLVIDKIKPIFNFQDCGLFILSKNGEYHSDLAAVLPDVSISEWNEKIAALSSNILHKDSPVEWMIEAIENAHRPVLFDFVDLVEKFPCYPQIDGTGLLDMCYRDCLATNLNVGGKTIGMFCINALAKDFFPATKFNILQSVGDTLAIAVANILANEEIVAKAKEIESLNKQLQVQNEYLIEEVEQQYNFEEMIGQNIRFAEVCKKIGLVAKTDSTVLILGETGTGKELVARAIHNNSTRKNKPLIKLNCAALPANLIESELFGHERGAFTGAIERRIGKFELANGSTLFLDEVGELPLELQAKLLRALQEREIERLGSNKILQVDVRIIAATNRELEKEVQAGKFRQDLYYRLHIFPVTLPPLKERKEDIPLLAAHFIERYAKKMGKKIQGLSSKAMQEMMSYNWPGNIRELEHVMERSVIMAKSKLIQDLNLPLHPKKNILTSSTEFVIKTWEEQERDYILEVLKVTKGNMAGKGGAAELLQLPPTTLQSKMNKLGIKRKHFLESKENQTR